MMDRVKSVVPSVVTALIVSLVVCLLVLTHTQLEKIGASPSAKVPITALTMDASTGAAFITNEAGTLSPGLLPGQTQAMLMTSSDAGAVNTSMTWQIPSGTAGELIFEIVGTQPFDGSIHQLSGDSTWRCGVTNIAGVCHIYRACAAANAWVGQDAGNAWTTTVAVTHPSGDAGTQCVATATVTGASGAGPIHWEATMKYNAVK
jgi:hypothetical protein